MLDAHWNVTFERVPIPKGMKTRVAYMYLMIMFRPVTYESRHVFNKYVVLFGGILTVFSQKQIDVVRSVSMWAEVFDRIVSLVDVRAQDVYRNGGVVSFEGGDKTSR